jgi:hypothetical protein
LPEEVSAEVDRFKSALRKMFKKLEKVPVFFERNYRSQHLQVQVVPVPKEDASAVKKTFMETASRLEVDLNEVKFLMFVLHCKQTLFHPEFNLYREKLSYKRYRYFKDDLVPA